MPIYHAQSAYVSTLIRSQVVTEVVSQTASPTSVFRSLKQLEVSQLSLDKTLVHHKVSPSIVFNGTAYTGLPSSVFVVDCAFRL